MEILREFEGWTRFENWRNFDLGGVGVFRSNLTVEKGAMEIDRRERGSTQTEYTEEGEEIITVETNNTQNYIMIILIALIQGALDLCNLCYFYIYLYDLRTSPSQLAILQGVATLPWVFKPLFGYISDHFKFLGYNRKSYIFTISLIEFTTHILMFKYRFGLPFVIFCQVMQVACVAFRNVIGGKICIIKRL